MKDIVVTSRRIRKECFIAACCLLAAFSVNVYAVIHYDRPWVELLSQLGFVVVIALGFYFLLAILRLIATGISVLLRK